MVFNFSNVVTCKCKTNIAYIFATVLPVRPTLISLRGGKKPLFDYDCVECTDGAAVTSSNEI